MSENHLMKTAAGKNYYKCGVALPRRAGDAQCPLVQADDAGRVLSREGVCFYVTTARVSYQVSLPASGT